MKRAETALFVAIACLFVYVTSFFDGFIQDDAFIFARYAQNILAGNGFVYNAGEHTEGATSFLWTWLGVLGGALGADIPDFLKFMGRAFGLLWLLVFWAVCRQWFQKPWQWVAPVLIFAVYPPLALWAQGGLETCFFGFLVMAGFYLVEVWHQRGSSRAFWALTSVAALLLLTRPEGLPVVGLYGLYMLLYPHPGKRGMVFRFFVPVAALTLGGLLTFRYLYFHDWVPNTYYAKGGGGYYLWRYGLANFNVFLRENANWVFWSLAFPVFFMRKRIWVLMLLVPMWTAYYIKSGGDILPQHRLLLPAVPFMLLGTFYFLDGIRSFYASPKLRDRYYNAVLILVAVLFAIRYESYYRNDLISFAGVRPALERAHGETGRYLATHMRAEDTAILTDAGMTALYAPNKHIVDWLGLCDSRVAHILYESGYNPWAMFYCKDESERTRRRETCHSAMQTYFDELQPRYVVLNVFLDNSTDQQWKMIHFYRHASDTLPDFVIQQISFEGYFGIFTVENRARGYKPVLVSPYNPNFWMVLVENDPKQKAPQGREAF